MTALREDTTVAPGWRFRSLAQARALLEHLQALHRRVLDEAVDVSTLCPTRHDVPRTRL